MHNWKIITYSADTRFFSSTVTKALKKLLQLLEIDSNLGDSLKVKSKTRKY